MAKKSPYYKGSKKSNTIEMTYWMIGFFIGLISVGILITAMYFSNKYENKNKQEIFNIPRINALSKDLEVSTAISLGVNQSGNEFLKAKNNDVAVKTIIENILYQADLNSLNNVEKITYLEKTVKEEIRKKLPQAHLQEVMITDFVYQNQ